MLPVAVPSPGDQRDLSPAQHRHELPERFGPWKTVHKRHVLWSADGTWERLLQHVQAVADAEGDIAWDVNVDSTSVRATPADRRSARAGQHDRHAKPGPSAGLGFLARRSGHPRHAR